MLARIAERSGRTYCTVLIFLALALACESEALAQAEEEDPSSRLNYAFAVYLGSGIYNVDGRTIQIYRIPVSYTIRQIEDRAWGLRIRAPLTFGFYDFKPSDVIDTGLPDDIGTISLVPEFQVPVRIRENWWLTPVAGFGAGKDMSGGELSYIYLGGLKSLAQFPRPERKYSLWNELMYIGHTVSGEENDEDFAMLETGLDIRWPIRLTFRGQPTDLSLFLANYLYFEPSEYFLSEDRSFEVGAQYEIGMTFGTVERYKLWRIPLPRIGLSYRFGDGVQAVRLVFGNQF
jgi:hypothetical protein